MITTIKGIIFDVDGVIINTEDLHYSAFKQVLQDYKYDLTKSNYKKHFSGKSIKGGILSLLSEVSIEHNYDLEDFITIFSREKIRLTTDLFKTRLLFYEDTLNFLSRIKSGNVNIRGIGLIKGSPVLGFSTGLEKGLVSEVLKYHNLEQLFTVQITAELYTHSKPHPECYQVALDKMQLNTKDVVGIEDSYSGIQALNKAEIFSIGLTTTHTQQELREAKLTTSSLMNLLDN